MIAWYVHHHGLGHLTRARAVRPHLCSPVQLFSSIVADDVHTLPLDVHAPASPACAGAAPPTGLHYAPLGVAGITDRMTTMAAWIASHRPSLAVVDVSVEVAMLMRLLSIPTVLIRQHGRRRDLAHRIAADNAVALIAPWPDWLEDDDVDADTLAKTRHVGGFSRFDGRGGDRTTARDDLGLGHDDRIVVVLCGAGGRVGWPVEEAAAATPGWNWHVVGRSEAGANRPPGWTEDPWPWLLAADVVVTHAGHNAVMEVAAARTPAVIVPQDRPHEEQRHKALALRREGLGQVEERWPSGDRWAQTLARTVAEDAHLGRLVDGGGAARAAEVLDGLERRYAGDAGRRPGPAAAR